MEVIEASIFTNLNNCDAKGKTLYQTNEHYKSVANMMEHPEFREFYEKYLKSPEDLQTILMFLKPYEELGRISPIALSPFQKIAIVESLINNPESRRAICQSVKKWANPEKTQKTMMLRDGTLEQNTKLIMQKKKQHENYQ